MDQVRAVQRKQVVARKAVVEPKGRGGNERDRCDAETNSARIFDREPHRQGIY